MWAPLWCVAVSVAALLVGYALGVRHEREAQREIAERAALTERDESDRTPGQPTNRSAEPSVVRRGRWASEHVLRTNDEEVQR